MIRSLTLAALSAYLFVILALTLAYKHPQYRPVSERLSLTPFQSVVRDVSRGGRAMWVNIVGNVVVFAPLGAGIAGLGGARARLRHAALAGFLLSAAIETAQFQTGRRFSDIDDVILNTLGAVLGFVAFAATRRLAVRREMREPAA